MSLADPDLFTDPHAPTPVAHLGQWQGFSNLWRREWHNAWVGFVGCSQWSSGS